MAFSVADSLLVRTLVGQFVPHLTRTPLLVPLLLDPFDPMVGDAHGHTEIEADSTCLEWGRQPGHTAHILGNGDG